MSRMTRKHRLLTGLPMTANERRLGRYLRDGSGHPEPAPAAGEPPAPEPTPDEAFASAFAEHSVEAPTTPVEPASPAASELSAGGEPAPAAPAAPGVPPAGSEPPVAAPAASEPAGTPPAAAPAQASPTADDIVKGLVEKLGQPAPAAPAPAAPAAEEAPMYQPDELAVITEYEKNWPDVSKAEQLKRRAEYSDIFKFVFSEMQKYVAPAFDQLRVIGNNLHMGELKAAVPDYSDTLESDVTAWIGTQPAYLQAPYKQVMQGGTSEEVADLIGRYRATTGVAPAAAPAAPAPAAAPGVPPKASAAAPKTELSNAAKQAAASLAPVSGDRSQVPQGEDPQDYQSAFAKHAASMDI